MPDSTAADTDAHYTLNKEYSLGDLKFKVNSGWKTIKTGESTIFSVNESVSFYAMKADCNSDLISEDDIFKSYMGQSATDISYEYVSGNRIVLFTKQDDYSRHIVTVIGNNSYDLFAFSDSKDASLCNSLVTDVFSTLTLPYKDM